MTPMRRLVAVVAVAILANAAGAAPPNVVLIISDDQAWTDYGFMGHRHIRTPRLDELASQGLVYRHAYVPASLCCPSLMTIATGRYPFEHRVTGNEPPRPDARTSTARRRCRGCSPTAAT
jgi:uncharacterized sulfatase